MCVWMRPEDIPFLEFFVMTHLSNTYPFIGPHLSLLMG